ncbi:calcium-binding protein [Nitrosomonas supralitoralis]|uniref:Hemolysin-type calcium-binding repeat-containing protein n=1 Tax=Nitrosomonas supralitoralis TaxID=2116706 RepID=A0A2P7NY94_9PROT|nr:calcium-binding protein [Nitrosomonas supralitoralis]PSJ18443.1 hypothetical protein C7H79_02330 [Nitrosomonas supralitoralis]
MSISIDDESTGQDDFTGDDNNDHFHAGDGDNTLTGGGGDDGLDGGAGNDVLTGDLGNDVLIGGEGNDNLNGGEGDDHLDGGEGDDILLGDLGDDVLHAGGGSDDLTGGAGNDQFSFYAAGNYTVQDFEASADLLIFESDSTGIDSLEKLVSEISSFEDTSEGVVVHFVNDVASITLIGIQSSDLTADMVGFS